MSTTRSSKKRAREVGWLDIFEENPLTLTEEFITPEQYMTMSTNQKIKFRRQNDLKVNLQEVQLRITQCFSRKPIPSPSNMKWDTIDIILENKFPLKRIQDFSGEHKQVKLDADAFMEILDTKFENRTEMEVVVRIFSLLVCVVSDLENVHIRLQPSEYGHPCFTEFLIEIRNGTSIKRLIEVKKSTIMVDLGAKSDETAQALREAHIMLQTSPVQTIEPFLITNGKVFSFGMVSKTETTKIRLEAVTTIICDLNSSAGWNNALTHLRGYITGAWPTAEHYQ